MPGKIGTEGEKLVVNAVNEEGANPALPSDDGTLMTSRSAAVIGCPGTNSLLAANTGISLNT